MDSNINKPCKATGIASFCILVGAFHFNAAQASQSTSLTPC